MRSRYTLILIVILVALSLLVDIPNTKIKFPLKLGLDLQGGTELVYQAETDNMSEAEKDQTMESVKGVLDKRLNPSGVAEITIVTSKIGSKRRLTVDLPGVADASKAAEQVGRTAKLEFKELPKEFTKDQLEATKSGIPLVVFATSTNLTGSDLQPNGAKVQPDSRGKGYEITLTFTDDGKKKFAEITKRNIGKELPVFLDQELLMAPVVQQEILGDAVITGSFTAEYAKDRAKLINGGALKIALTPLSHYTVPPNLGKESLNKSLVAAAIGILIILIYMVAYYGLLGLIADLGLLIYAILVLAIFKTGIFILPPVTLTLAGIAGFILSIGMAVDANILIFERMKEEKRWGKSQSLALELGFKRAWTSIWASNASSLLTASILYAFGTSIVRGFAITLAIGVLVSMFTAIIVTRTLLRLFYEFYKH